jgi:hypothetical protein
VGVGEHLRQSSAVSDNNKQSLIPMHAIRTRHGSTCVKSFKRKMFGPVGWRSPTRLQDSGLMTAWLSAGYYTGKKVTPFGRVGERVGAE